MKLKFPRQLGRFDLSFHLAYNRYFYRTAISRKDKTFRHGHALNLLYIMASSLI
ncbi:MAG: hypothetical protein L0Z73_16350 [Gammaproteobacteria bacterium]|nr:hypothetical protein [Gammaproteobacteria bacterium]